MKTLIVGAGGTGGAFGARLIEAGRDVTFLVRERRKSELDHDGLVFRDPQRQSTLSVTAVTSLDTTDAPFDLVIFAVKAPGLAASIETARAGIGPNTRIIPFLNGLDHIDTLEAAFPGQVLGGIVKIVATLEAATPESPVATVVQMTPLSTMIIGSLDGSTVREDIVENLTVPGIKLQIDNNIQARLWEKWAFIAAAGVECCLFRSNVGAIMAAGGHEAILRIISETEQVAAAAGYPVSAQSHDASVAMLTEEGSAFTSSLYRDLLAGNPAEAEHILGALAVRARELGVPTPLLDLTLIQVRAGVLAARAA